MTVIAGAERQALLIPSWHIDGLLLYLPQLLLFYCRELVLLLLLDLSCALVCLVDFIDFFGGILCV